MAATINGRTETIKVLLKNGADVNIKAKNGFTALDVATSQGQGGALSPEVKQMLLDAGAK
jgi:ankyrin repeat protein